MASLSSDNQTIQFYDADGKRRTLRIKQLLGRNATAKATANAARRLLQKIESLNVAAIANTPVDPETAAWVAELNDSLYGKLEKLGLVPKREKAEQSTLATFLDGYIGSRSDVKAATAVMYKQVRRGLVEHFGADCRLSDITAGDAEDWRRWLSGEKKLAENTVRRRCGIARQFFRVAEKKRLIQQNPFGEMKGVAVRSNRSRDYFVTREEADKVLKACPCDEWRLLFALSRYGGLRCPSEHLALRWGDIHWDTDKITVHSPKTAHHDRGESRVIPLFPELRPYLDAVWDAAQERDEQVEYVINRYRDRNANLRTQLERIIKRAGLTPWPKLFQNLRATRATELAAEFPAHVAAEWLGHSTVVAQEHYWRTTDDDFARATGKALPPALLSATVREGSEENRDDAATADTPENTEKTVLSSALVDEASSPGGNRTTASNAGKNEHPGQSAARSAATPRNLEHSGPSPDAKLARVIDRWPTLPESVRAAVLRLVDGDA